MSSNNAVRRLVVLTLAATILALVGSAGQSLAGKPAPAPTPAPGCVLREDVAGWWPGDGDANDIVWGNNGLLVGSGITYAPGKIGQAFSFNWDGVGARPGVKVPPVPGQTLSSITIVAWIKPYQAGPIVEFLYGSSGYVGTHFWVHPGPKDLYGAIVQDITYHPTLQASGVITSGRFQHVALTYESGSSTFSLYRNGSLVATAFALSYWNLKTDEGMSIGLREGQEGVPPIPYPPAEFKGLIDEIAVFKRALSQAEINAIYKTGICVR